MWGTNVVNYYGTESLWPLSMNTLCMFIYLWVTNVPSCDMQHTANLCCKESQLKHVNLCSWSCPWSKSWFWMAWSWLQLWYITSMPCIIIAVQNSGDSSNKESQSNSSYNQSINPWSCECSTNMAKRYQWTSSGRWGPCGHQIFWWSSRKPSCSHSLNLWLQHKHVKEIPMDILRQMRTLRWPDILMIFRDTKMCTSLSLAFRKYVQYWILKIQMLLLHFGPHGVLS